MNAIASLPITVLINMMNKLSVGVCILDANLNCVATNQRWRQFFHLKETPKPPVNYGVVRPQLPPRWQGVFRQCLTGQTQASHIEKLSLRSDEKLWVKWQAQPWYVDDQKIGGVIIEMQAQSSEQRADIGPVKERERYDFATISGGIGVWDWDITTNFLSWNRVMYDLFDLTEETFQNDYESFAKTLHPDDLASVSDQVNQALMGLKPFSCTYRIILKNGTIRYINSKAEFYYDDEGSLVRMLGICQDVTVEVTAREKLHHALQVQRKIKKQLEKIAWFDDLTALPNRHQLLKTLKEYLRKFEVFSLLLIDLNNFKQINDSCGHQVGDQCLRYAADQLREVITNSDFLARLSGDEFVLLTQLTDQDSVLTLANQLMDRLSMPLQVAGQKITITVSIGIAPYHGEGFCPDELLRRADMAMYQAKAKPKCSSHTVVYRQDFSQHPVHCRFDKERLCLIDDN